MRRLAWGCSSMTCSRSPRLDERRPLQLENLDLTTIAADAVNDFRAVEPDRPASLVAPVPVPIVGDETGIRQVFANLLTNARVHTDAGTPVEVRVGATPTAGAHRRHRWRRRPRCHAV